MPLIMRRGTPSLRPQLAVTRMEIGTDVKDGSGEVDVQDDDHLPLLDRPAVCVAGLEAQEVFKAPTHA